MRYCYYQLKCDKCFFSYNLDSPGLRPLADVLHFNLRGRRGVCERKRLEVVALKEETLDPTAPCQRVTVKQVLLGGEDAVGAPVRV